MKKLIYIGLMLGLLCSCVTEKIDPMNPQGEISEGEATISFSALMPAVPASTKALGGTLNEEISNLYLVIFDENGMLVETRKAEIGDEVTHDGHPSERKYTVTLSLTEKKRFIHFIANCPADQIIYGHESSVIGNMYVENGKVAYWARIEVPKITVKQDADGNNTNALSDDIAGKFKCVPMLRNYAQLFVINEADDFEFEGYLIYNVINRGTVAPYNSTTMSFQSFIKDNGTKYYYPELYDLPYHGHALTSTELVTDLPTVSGAYDFETVTDNQAGPTYLYERKVSVRSADESQWRESPPHLIVKGKFEDDTLSTYYKVDIIRIIDGVNQYYNILRNFHYNFTIHSVAASGYKTVEEAVAGATSNNLSASASTAHFDNISDSEGRLYVSFTDTTLVDNSSIKFYYKYIPDLDSPDATGNDLLSDGNETGVAFNGFDADGEVIKNYTIATSDVSTGAYKGYRMVTLGIKDVSSAGEIFRQSFTLRTNNPSLSRTINLILKPRYTMQVECTEKVAASIGEEVQVDIYLPDDLTSNMFPLDLDIEAYNLSLSPDASKNTLPVVSGLSTIPGKEDKTTFHYVKTIESYEEYKDLQTATLDGNTYVIIPTYWITNKADNASTVYVTNKYFNPASDYFINPMSFNGEFSKSSLGIDAIETVEYTFDIHEPLQKGMVVTVTLDRLEPISSAAV